jgi:hypothetical protein
MVENVQRGESTRPKQGSVHLSDSRTHPERPDQAEELTGTEPFSHNRQTNVKKLTVSLYLLLILLGVGTGYVLAGGRGAAALPFGIPARVEKDAAVGSSDTETFKDSAVGVIEAGGVDGEGTHKLVREGGPSQTAYLISSVVDLDDFVGKKVKVYGQTVAGEKASWLMDVGKVELEP